MGSGDDEVSSVSTHTKAESGDDSFSHGPPQVEKIYCINDWRAVPKVWRKMWKPRTSPGGKGPGQTPCGPWEAVQCPESYLDLVCSMTEIILIQKSQVCGIASRDRNG